jgi:hypothetical protein
LNSTKYSNTNLTVKMDIAYAPNTDAINEIMKIVQVTLKLITSDWISQLYFLGNSFIF